REPARAVAYSARPIGRCSNPARHDGDVASWGRVNAMMGALLESRSSEVGVLVNGVLLCSQLRDQVVLVPLWQSLEPDEARQWFKKNGLLPAVLHAPLICAGLLAAV